MSAHSSELIETYRGAVYPWHCDHMGHMNVMWYVGKFDEATWNLFAAMGVTAAFLKENQRGMAAGPAEHHLPAGAPRRGYRARALGIPRGARESSEVRS